MKPSGMPLSKDLLHELENVSNPFEHRCYLNNWQKLQLVIMSLTVFPLRVIGLLIAALLLCTITAIGTFGLPLVPKKPIDGWRRQLSPAVRRLLRFIYFCCGYHKICVRGRPNLDPDHDPDIIVAAPHSTFFDPIALFALNELPTGVSRIENIQLPFLGYITKFFSPICVTRSNQDSRRETINQIKSRVQSRMKFRSENSGCKDREEGGMGPRGECDSDVVGINWSPICLFPEGTTGNGRHLITFKMGAFIPGEAVQPVCVQHINSMNTTSWTFVGEGVWKILWMTMCQFSTTAILTILPLYVPSAEEKASPELFASNVQGFMGRHMGISPVDFNFYDAPFVVYLSKLHLLPLTPLVRLNRILIDISKRSEVDFSRVAENMAGSSFRLQDHLLAVDDFSRFVENFQPLKPLLDCGVSAEEFFRATSRPGSEFVDVRRFLCWLCLALQPQRTWVVVEVAFKAFGSEGKEGEEEEEILSGPQLGELVATLFHCHGVELDVTMDYISTHCNEPTPKNFLKLAKAWDPDHAVCRCAEMMRKFSLEKSSLLRSDPSSVAGRRWKNCRRCAGELGACGRGQLCREFEEALRRCREVHPLRGILPEEEDEEEDAKKLD